MSPLYEQETVLAMELNRSHIGCLVQIITEDWSMTGTLKRVDQHDNREWEIVYPGYGLVPSAGEIYAVLAIGPWEGRVIGNQPVTVERVAGTLEAPERAGTLTVYTDGDRRVGLYVPDPEPPAKLGYIVPEDVALGSPEFREIHGDVSARAKGYYPEGMGEDPPDVIEGDVVEPDLPPAPEEWPDLPKD